MSEIASIEENSKALYAIKMQVAELKAEKNKYILQKFAIAADLTEAKNQVRSGRLTDTKYQQILQKQSHAANKMVHIEANIGRINNSLRALFAKEDSLRILCGGTGANLEIKEANPAQNNQMMIIESIRSLQKKYLEFSEDSTRISSMRIMAGTVAKDLTDLLRQINL